MEPSFLTLDEVLEIHEQPIERYAMAAAYLFHLCQYHPFLDGNKRTGANGAITFR